MQVYLNSRHVNHPKVIKGAFSPTNLSTLLPGVSTHMGAECYCICVAAHAHTCTRTRPCVKWSNSQENLRLSEGKTHTHTHTLHEYGAKRQNEKNPLIHWKHLGEHTHTHTRSQLWGHDSFHSRLQLHISRKRDFTLNFSTHSFRRRRKTEGRARADKNTSEHISIFGSW